MIGLIANTLHSQPLCVDDKGADCSFSDPYLWVLLHGDWGNKRQLVLVAHCPSKNGRFLT
jgi:hypothetical protein